MRLDLLGPLRVEIDGNEVHLAAAKERSLVAVLALRADYVVDVDTLVAALWGDRPPATAKKTLQTYVSNVRRLLGADTIVTAPTGYRLNVHEDDVDVIRFRRAVHDGHFHKAVSLWRGEPFADVASHSALAGEAVRLREEYLSALEARIAADLDAGQHHELIGELESLTRTHPFRERLWAQLMLAQYRCERQADALATYQRARATLTEDLGLEPGGELRRMEGAVLAHDPSLRVVAPATTTDGGDGGPLARSPVRYARTNDGVHVAYQVVGSGPLDIVVVPGFVSHLDIWWDAPTDRLVRRLASIGRLILFDKRGMGLSDRPSVVDAASWMDDLIAVLDEVGSQRPVVLGVSAGAPTAITFAAHHRDRVGALAIYGGYARMLKGPDYPFGFEPGVAEAFNNDLEARWGSGAGMSVYAPSLVADTAARDYWARYQRTSASPGAAAAFLRALTAVDVRHELAQIDAPTLILHPQRDHMVPIEAARVMAAAIRDAQLIELDSDIHLIWLSDVVDEITDALGHFLDQTDHAVDPTYVLATIVALDPAPSTTVQRRSVDDIVGRHGGSVDATGSRASFLGSPAAAVRCALELATRTGLAAGAHTGECTVSAYGVAGTGVTIATAIAAHASPAHALVSQTVRDVTVGSGLALQPCGEVRIDGIEGEWAVFSVTNQ